MSKSPSAVCFMYSGTTLKNLYFDNICHLYFQKLFGKNQQPKSKLPRPASCPSIAQHSLAMGNCLSTNERADHGPSHHHSHQVGHAHSVQGHAHCSHVYP